MNFFKVNDMDDCGQKIHLMAHSKGATVVEFMMMQLNKELRFGLPVIFEEIILLAADVDYDIFESPNAFYNLIDICERVHLYYHKKDRVLLGSKFRYNPDNRLGRYGMKNSSPLVVPEDVYECNVTSTKDDKGTKPTKNFLNHWYYMTSTPVIEDIKGVLEGELSRYVRLNQIYYGTRE